MNRHALVCLTVSIALSGCASRPLDPPTCDGLHRRDANPHGSTLIEETVEAPTPSSDIAPHASLSDPRSFAACSRGAA